MGVGAYLLLVKCGNDGEITPEMMLDPNGLRLLSVDSRVLSAGEKKWLTSEVETYGMYRALRKWAGLLMRLSQLGPGTWPPLLWMDSSTAMSKLVGVSIPQSIDHENAKEKRFNSWAEKVSCVKYIDMEMRWIAGSANDFASLLSRVAEQIGKAVRERDEEPRVHWSACDAAEGVGSGTPRVHNMSRVLKVEGKKEHNNAPRGYEAVHLSMSKEEWASVAEAYYADMSMIQSVKAGGMYRRTCNGGAGVSAETRMKVQPWIGRRCFSV